MSTRRKVLIGGAVVLTAAVAGGAFALAGGMRHPVYGGGSRGEAENLGGGFYMLNGWILTEADLDGLH